MTATSLIFMVAGIALIAIGAIRARAPWARYQALRDQEANVARYEAWRGGLRTQGDGPTGASLLMAEFRRQAIIGAVLAVVGVVLVVIGIAVQ